MTSASPVDSVDSGVSPHALVLARRAETDDLGETIAALAARLHAATYELLVVLREFDERKGWNDGMVVIRGRLAPEVGAAVQRALDAAADRLFRESAGAPSGDAIPEEVTPGQRRADALGLLAEAALAAGLDRGTAGDR